MSVKLCQELDVVRELAHIRYIDMADETMIVVLL
jgi:hypothetical protein